MFTSPRPEQSEQSDPHEAHGKPLQDDDDGTGLSVPGEAPEPEPEAVRMRDVVYSSSTYSVVPM